MKKIKILVAISIAAFIITIGSVSASAIVFRSRNKDAKLQITNQTSKFGTLIAGAGDSNSAQETIQLTAGTVATHATDSDCWMIIDNTVYNFTAFLPTHPGGAPIMAIYCGKDGTQAFATKDKNPASDHSNLAKSLLSKYYIAPLGASLNVASTSDQNNPSTSNPSSTTNNSTDTNSNTSQTSTSTALTSTSTSTSGNNGMSVSDVSSHNTASNCWLIISNKVYDVSSYLVQHPGGVSVVTPYCGKEATNAFRTKNTNSAHSSFAYTLLNNYYIATLGSGITTTPTPTPTAIPTIANTTLTSTSVSSHNTANNCWLIISNNVYDVSSYLVQHPGGVSVVTPYCGKEATSVFQTKGGNSGNHSTNAYNLLNQYKVGTLGAVITPTPTMAPGVPTHTPTPTTRPTNTPTPIPTVASTLTSSIVASHNTSSNCWLIISNNVYDVSSYLVQHPGGVSVVTPYCGKEATSVFQTKGGNSGNHSTNAYNLLNQYKVGTLGAVITPTPTTNPTVPTRTPTPTTRPTSTPTPIPTTASSTSYTSSQVASHNTSSNCWLIISNNVYDVSSYLVQHPGGVSVVTPYCGKESTSAFQTKGSKGSNHSSSAYTKLAQYKVGTLSTSAQPTATPTIAQGGGGNPTATPTSASNPTATPTKTPTPTTANNSLPQSVVDKYPGALIIDAQHQDNNSWEIKLNYQGQCRDIRVNSTGSITSDKKC